MRRAVLLLGLALVLVVSGCASPFGGISQEALCPSGDYDLSTDANATYTVRTNGTYQAVYRLQNTSTIELYQTDGLGNDQPLQIRSIAYVGADGTEYNCEDVEVSTARRRTIVELPADNGTFAYSTSTSPKRFSTRTFVEGSHEVVLPEDRSIGNPIFGSVSPAADERTTVDGRVHIRWDEVASERITVQYYLQRDIFIFFGLAGVAAVLALAGLAYYYRLIARLKRTREEAGLDVDIEDDGRDPPPGMG